MFPLENIPLKSIKISILSGRGIGITLPMIIVFYFLFFIYFFYYYYYAYDIRALFLHNVW